MRYPSHLISYRYVGSEGGSFTSVASMGETELGNGAFLFLVLLSFATVMFFVVQLKVFHGFFGRVAAAEDARFRSRAVQDAESVTVAADDWF